MSNLYDQDLEELDDRAGDDVEDAYDDDEEDYEAIPGEMSGGRKVLLVLMALFVVLVIVAGGIGFWVMRQIDPAGSPGDVVRVSVPSGSSTAAIGEILEDEGVITDATIWRFYTRFKGAGPFQAGDYEFHENSAMGDAIAVLDGGPLPPPSEQFTVPEGLTTDETLATISERVPAITIEALNEALASGQVRSGFQPPEAIIEGFLYPETYRIEQGQGAMDVLASMVAQFDQVANEVGLPAAPERVGLSPYEAVIVASLIQEEAKIAEEAPMVARVIYNRLAEGIPLGIDATLCYVDEEKPCSLTRSDLEREGPYNSRLNAGLPPTPIASPGQAALEAALNPADGPWLYYVLDAATEADGDHFFTDSFSEFNAKKAECQAAGLC